MVRAITQRNDLPAYAAEVVERVTKLGFNWRFIENQRLADPGKRVQVRDTAHLAPAREVARYAQALRRGDQMPPVVMTADKWLVDGSTRTEAARRLGWDNFAAVVIDSSYENAPQQMRKQIQKLGTAFNNTHGRGMTPDEIASLIETIAEDDDRPRDLATEMHLPVSTVNTIVNAVRARRRGTQLGVTFIPGVLTNSHLKLFGAKSDKYTGPVFAEMLSLVQDARLTIPQATSLMKDVLAADTESARMVLLSRERAQYKAVIDQFRNARGNVRQSPSRAGRVRQSLGFLLGQEPDKLVELNVQDADKYLRTLNEAIEKLQKVRDAQMQIVSVRYSER